MVPVTTASRFGPPNRGTAARARAPAARFGEGVVAVAACAAAGAVVGVVEGWPVGPACGPLLAVAGAPAGLADVVPPTADGACSPARRSTRGVAGVNCRPFCGAPGVDPRGWFRLVFGPGPKPGLRFGTTTAPSSVPGVKVAAVAPGGAGPVPRPANRGRAMLAAKVAEAGGAAVVAAARALSRVSSGGGRWGRPLTVKRAARGLAPPTLRRSTSSLLRRSANLLLRVKVPAGL